MLGFNNSFFKEPAERYHKTIVLDAVFSRRVRGWISVLSGTIVIIYIGVLCAPLVRAKLLSGVAIPTQYQQFFGDTVTVPSADQVVIPTSAPIPNLIPFVGGTRIPLDTKNPIGNGVFLIALSVWLTMKMLRFYGNSYYYYVEALLERGAVGAQTPYTIPNYEVAEIYYAVSHGDLLFAFATSRYGRHILTRCGIGDESVREYLKNRTTIVNFSEKESELREVFTLFDLSNKITELDPDFYQFLFGLGVRKRELVGATEWVERQIKKRKQKQRFWGKVSLGQSPSFGADFAYGSAYALGRFSHDLSKEAIGGGSSFHFIYGSDQIKQLEVVLARSKEANAILVGEEGTGKMDVILDFARDIMNGYINPTLKHKRVMAFDANAFIATMKTKQELETALIRIMNDAVKAGNIILVIDDLPGFIQGALAIDADVVGILDPYLSGDFIQVIATADNSRFHQFIEPNNAIMKRFEKVMLTEPAEASLVRIIEEVAEETERRNPIFFTYPAITEIISGAQHYFSEGVMPDKAIDILVELTPSMLARGGHIVKKVDVLRFIHEKTSIPVGDISEEERDRLLNLETIMKKLVVGQEEALQVIANAMRRSRAGVRNMNRPIGAFLFLGPTGVGKTETAKALATVFFGNENAMARLDMSEYQGDDGLDRMIGGMDGTPGALTVLLKEQPYGVLLLDEFEKTNTKVLDLFLQVLDEGVFHDAQGKKVNARNTIFIATSNAGASQIREAMHEGKELESVKKEIIDTIIGQGKLKPELFNRFDGIILFHPLTVPDYRRIAELMLKKLQKRLREKSINLVINDVIIDAVMLDGVDPDMGARPMTRAIQEVVEQKVAEKIIGGKLEQGSTLVFTRADFPRLSAEAKKDEPLSAFEQALLHLPDQPPVE